MLLPYKTSLALVFSVTAGPGTGSNQTVGPNGGTKRRDRGRGNTAEHWERWCWWCRWCWSGADGASPVLVWCWSGTGGAAGAGGAGLVPGGAGPVPVVLVWYRWCWSDARWCWSGTGGAGDAGGAGLVPLVPVVSIVLV